MHRSIKVSFVAMAAVLALGSAPAIAAPGDADENARKGSRGGATVYDFEDDSVEGEVLSPEGALINGRVRGKHANMITIKPHFIPQLIRLANDV